MYNEIEAIAEKDVKEIMKFSSSALPQDSKMVFVIRQRGRDKGEVKETLERSIIKSSVKFI